MATIKAYTDLEQSKKLAKILPLETADMRYEAYYISPKDGIIEYEKHPHFAKCIENCTPCWSLASLWRELHPIMLNNETQCLTKLENLPNGNVRCYYENDDFILEVESDNPVDACYKMIIRLNELNLL